MITPSFSGEWVTLAAYLANHLWQSTLFLAGAWALTVPLRHHQARARYWLWLVASLKFLLPFSRIVRIMANRRTRILDPRRKLVLVAAAALAVAVPLAFGLTHAGQSAATTPDASATILPNAKFEVASIRPAGPPGRFFQFLNQPGRLYANYLSLKDLVEAAYNMQGEQVEGGPKWLDSDHYDIQAKADPAVTAELKKLPLEEARQVQRHMLQELLAERFHLNVERMTKQMPVYVLIAAKNGSKMKQSRPQDTISGQEAEGPREWSNTQKDGGTSFRVMQMNMDYFAGWLAAAVHRLVQNRTGLKGNYDFTLTYAPDFGEAPAMAGTAPAPTMSEPSIFTALREQLGLELKSEKRPVQALEIVSATQPTAN